MILEAVKSATPIIITGHILGQENENYRFVEDNNYGFKCENPNYIYIKLNNFIKSNKLDQYLNNVLNSKCTDGSDFIANYIKDNLK